MITAPDAAARVPDEAPGCSVHAVPTQPTTGEARTRWVVILTLVMMVAELVAGTISNSLALIADGWHMGTHAGALGLSVLAYWYARTRAKETRFAFGTGKVYALAGYTSAGLLLAVAVGMIVEAVQRFHTPEAVRFAEAMPVAVIGLIVNLISARMLDAGHQHGHQQPDHHHDPGHDHEHHHDHNLRAAYLHVVADALTSVLAIGALLAGQYLHWAWADPAVAVLGAAIILKWGLGLMASSARQLVDLDPSTKLRDKVRLALEQVGHTKVEDLHLWRVGPGQLVCVVSVSSSQPGTLSAYKEAAMSVAPIDHLTIEICPRPAA